MEYNNDWVNRMVSIADTAITLHKAWMDLVNFHHPGELSSNMEEALIARKAKLKLQDTYDEAFARLTSTCELYRQKYECCHV